MTTILSIVFSFILFNGMQHTPLVVLEPSGIGSCPQYIGLFALGCMGAVLAFGTYPSLNRLRDVATSPWAILGLSLAVIAVTFVFYLPHKSFLLARIAPLVSPLARRDLLVGIWAMSFMAAAGKNPHHWAFRPLSSRFLVFLGTFAYSTYLTHAHILTLVKCISTKLFTGILPFQFFLIEATVGIGAAIGISYLFHLAFERPFMSKPGQAAPKTEQQAEVAAIVNPAP